jgi:MazG family protein
MSKYDFLLNALNPKQDPLSYAVAMQKAASEVGFDWPEINGVIAKIHEEIDELKYEITHDQNQERLQDELGDLLFACCNLARHLGITPTEALSGTNQKFYRRFNYVETRVVASEKDFKDFSLKELDSFWDEAKLLEQLEDNESI